MCHRYHTYRFFVVNQCLTLGKEWGGGGEEPKGNVQGSKTDQMRSQLTGPFPLQGESKIRPFPCGTNHIATLPGKRIILTVIWW